MVVERSDTAAKDGSAAIARRPGQTQPGRCRCSSGEALTIDANTSVNPKCSNRFPTVLKKNTAIPVGQTVTRLIAICDFFNDLNPIGCSISVQGRAGEVTPRADRVTAEETLHRR